LKLDRGRARCSGLAEIRQDRVNELESLIDLLADLGTREDNFAGNEDKQNDLGLHHTVDETGEQLRLVGRESVVARCKTLQTNRELDVAGSDDILNFEVLRQC
jgi:hypothetical protein